jgi:hypothetical protein
MKLILFVSLLLLPACKETCKIRPINETDYVAEVESGALGDWGSTRHVCGKDFKDCNEYCDRINYPKDVK